MNVTETNKVLTMGRKILAMIDVDKVGNIKEQMESMQDAVQEKIDRMEGFDNLSDVTQERLDKYSERLEYLEYMISTIDSLMEYVEELDGHVNDLGGTLDE